MLSFKKKISKAKDVKIKIINKRIGNDSRKRIKAIRNIINYFFIPYGIKHSLISTKKFDINFVVYYNKKEDCYNIERITSKDKYNGRPLRRLYEEDDNHGEEN